MDLQMHFDTLMNGVKIKDINLIKDIEENGFYIREGSTLHCGFLGGNNYLTELIYRNRVWVIRYIDDEPQEVYLMEQLTDEEVWGLKELAY